ncbi:oxidoreductase [Azorhizobium doebereinerae]|uniref:oxidoreductase n=1 Tax=Azorhizobium doebereinerae TaxID=281091 RepID=UPI0003F66C6B|nr:oxidoreductase [Azorhizobium doebereinerae]
MQKAYVVAKIETKTALVTGASGGIGLTTALALRKAGYRVFGTSRRAEPSAEPGITMLQCDVTDDASVAGVVESVLAQTGRIDVLVNNAGFGIAGGAEESSIEQARMLFEVNVFGLIRMVRAVLPAMRAQGRGRIVNISSVFGFMPAPYMALYAATKHAVEGYSESLDHEVRVFGVRVVLIEPANTATAFDKNLARADQPLEPYAGARSDNEVLMGEMMKTGDAPETIAAAIVAAAEAKTPKRRYAPGSARQLSLARRFAPSGVFDKSLRKQMRLPRAS